MVLLEWIMPLQFANIKKLNHLYDFIRQQYGIILDYNSITQVFGFLILIIIKV